MHKFTFSVSIVANEIDGAAVHAALRNCVEANIPQDGFASVKRGPIKLLSEQGFKVSRARIAQVTTAMAGDAHNGKVGA